MRKERILAVIMSVLLALSLLPVTAFAAENTTLDGKLKIQGKAAEGRTLSAEFKEVKPEGLTEDDVTYLWERKTTEDEAAEKSGEKPELKELGKAATYVVTKEDVGSKIVLTITGKEENGYSGSLTVVSETVIDAQTAADQEAKAAEEKAAASEDNTDVSEEQNTEESAEETPAEGTDEAVDESETPQTDMTETTDANGNDQEDSGQAGNETVDGIPAATTDEEKQQDESAGSESVDGIPEATEDGTYGPASEEQNTETDAGNTSEEAEASIVIGDGSVDSVDFGTVPVGEEENVEAQYVTITNTGNTTLNFTEISPEHFMVQDISDPMEQNSSQQLWIVPRPGVEAGIYDDTITYTSEEGVEISFEAKMTVEAGDTETPAPSETPADTGNTDAENPSETPADTGNTDAENPSETPSDSGNTDVEKPEDNNSGTDNGQDDQKPENPDGNNGTEEPAEEPASSRVTPGSAGADFGTLVEGYTDIPSAQTITLTNEGDADAVLSEAVSNTGAAQGTGQYFDITWTASTVAKNGGTAEFTIQPKAGLSANAYTESFTITDNTNNSAIVINATVTVETADPSLDVSVSALDFATAKKGYGEIQAQQFTVTNSGNVTQTLEQPALTNFNVSLEPDQLTLAPGEAVVYTVQPMTGLDVGAYSETLKVSSDKSVPVTFQVVKGNAVLTKIQQPAAVTGLENGTKKDASSLKLPSTVVIETTEGSMKAAVSWNVKDASYKQSSTEAQKFTVSGTVTLPSGVDNDNQISLSTSVEVSVNAYSAKIASAEKNKITGIDANGVYTTQTKISFTAVGAGMDNNSPRKGDTRYVPQSWTVINTNVWNAAPYTASFGLAQSGDYTLKVAFGQQQYDGSTWKSTGTTDTRQVSFSITKAKVTAPGTNLTPTANKKNAVKTGDNTPILPFVCILIVAAGAIGGVVFYKKKNKK